MIKYISRASLVSLLLCVGVAFADTDLVVSKIVNEPTPTPGSSVEFEVTITNDGPDSAVAIDVVDSLPSGLIIPVGMAPFTSQGNYDANSGLWQVGALPVTQTAVLTIPAVPAQSSVASCTNNHAEIISASPSDPRPDNNTDSAAVFVGGATECAELILTAMPVVTGGPGCFDPTLALEFDVEVFNAGPDVAQNVNLSLTGTHWRLANVTPNDNISFGAIDVGETATGLMDWQFFCGQGPSTPTYEIMLESSSTLASNSIVSVTGDVDVPTTGTCDCSVSLPGSCFIAMAAYGSYLDPQVIALR